MRPESPIARAVAGLIAFAVLVALVWFFVWMYNHASEKQQEHLRIHPQIERRIR